MIKKVYISKLISRIILKVLIKYEDYIVNQSKDDTMVNRFFAVEFRKWLDSSINKDIILVLDLEKPEIKNKCEKTAISMLKKFKSCFPCMVISNEILIGLNKNDMDSVAFQKRFSNSVCF